MIDYNYLNKNNIEEILDIYKIVDDASKHKRAYKHNQQEVLDIFECGSFLGAFNNGKMIGVCFTKREAAPKSMNEFAGDEVVRLGEVAILPGFRDQGIHKHFIEARLDHLIGTDLKVISTIHPDDNIAHEKLKEAGFVDFDAIVGIDREEAKIILARDLPQLHC